MTDRSLRATGLLVALAATISASLFAPASTATAVTAVDAAAPVLGFGSRRVTEMPGVGDITSLLKTAAQSVGSAAEAHVIHLSGTVEVKETVRPANYVYLVAEPGTRVTWRGPSANLIRFESTAGRVTGGIYGGTWDGADRGDTTLIHLGNATVSLANLTVTRAGRNGIGAYAKSALTLLSVTAIDNDYAGVYVADSSRLTASGLHSTLNQVNGVQLARHSVGTITDSVLDRNGQAVKGSTTNKSGHGLGIDAASATVVRTSMSSNKVCGVSLTEGANATISDSHLDNNGRHGLGTVPGVSATISSSTVNKNGYNGVLATGKRTSVTLDHVTISVAKKNGLSVPSGGSVRMTDSIITGGGNYDVSVSGRGSLSLLGGNTIGSSRSHGVMVSGKSRLLISGAGNVVASNRRDGIRLTGSGTTGSITDSVLFRNNRDSAIAVMSKAKLTMVTCAYSGNDKTVEKRSGGTVRKVARP